MEKQQRRKKETKADVVRDKIGIEAWASLNSVRDFSIEGNCITFDLGVNRYSYEILQKPLVKRAVTHRLSRILDKEIELRLLIHDPNLPV